MIDGHGRSLGASREHEVVAVHGLLGRPRQHLAHLGRLQALHLPQLGGRVVADPLADRAVAVAGADLDRVAGVELARRRRRCRPAAGSCRPRAARARRPRRPSPSRGVGFAYLSHSLKLDWRTGLRREARAHRARPPRRAPSTPRLEARCRSRPGSRPRWPSRRRRPSSASRPSRAARPTCRSRAPRALDESVTSATSSRAGLARAGRPCRGRRCRSAARAGRRRRAPRPARRGSRCRRRRSRRWSSCRSR